MFFLRPSQQEKVSFNQVHYIINAQKGASAPSLWQNPKIEQIVYIIFRFFANFRFMR